MKNILTKSRKYLLLFSGLFFFVSTLPAQAQQNHLAQLLQKFQKIKSPYEQRKLLLQMGKEDPTGQKLFPFLVKVANGKNELLKATALWLMRTTGKKALPYLLKAMNSRSALVKASALEALIKLGVTDDQVLKAYYRATLDRDRMISIAAIQHLGSLKKKLPKSLTVRLIRVAQEKLNKFYFERAVFVCNILSTLDQLGERSKPFHTLLLSAAKHRNLKVRYCAVKILRQKKYASFPNVVLALQLRLKDPTLLIRRLVRQTLIKWKKPLKIPVQKVRLRKIKKITVHRKISKPKKALKITYKPLTAPQKKKVLSLLKILNTTEKKSVVLATMHSLHAMGKDVVPFLATKLSSLSNKGKVRLARLFGLFGQQAEAAVPQLAKIHRSISFSLRQEIAFNLGKLGPKGIKALVKALRGYWNVRKTAQAALVNVGLPAVPYLISTALNGTWTAKRSSKKALIKIGRPIVPTLYLLMKTKNFAKRRLATELLGKLGKKAIILPKELYRVYLCNDLSSSLPEYKLLYIRSNIAHLFPYFAPKDLIPFLKYNMFLRGWQLTKVAKEFAKCGDKLLPILKNLFVSSPTLRYSILTMLQYYPPRIVQKFQKQIIASLNTQNFKFQKISIRLLVKFDKKVVATLFLKLLSFLHFPALMKDAAAILYKFKLHPKRVIAELTLLAVSSQSRVVSIATDYLGKYGKAARSAQPVLLKAAQESSSDIFKELDYLQALLKIGAPLKLLDPFIRKNLKASYLSARRTFDVLIKPLGVKARPFAPELLAMLPKITTEWLKRDVLVFLAKLQVKKALPLFMEAYKKSSSNWYKRGYCQNFAQYSSLPPKYFKFFKKEYEKSSSSLKVCLIRVLFKSGKKGEKYVFSLFKNKANIYNLARAFFEEKHLKLSFLKKILQYIQSQKDYYFHGIQYFYMALAREKSWILPILKKIYPSASKMMKIHVINIAMYMKKDAISLLPLFYKEHKATTFWRFKEALILAIPTIEPSSKKRMAFYLKAMNTTDFSERWRIRKNLFKEKNYLQLLKKALHSDKTKTKLTAIDFLSRISSKAHSLLPDIVPLLQDLNTKLRLVTLKLLIKMKPKKLDLMETLIPFFKTNSLALHRVTLQLLFILYPKFSSPKLVGLLEKLLDRYLLHQGTLRAFPQEDVPANKRAIVRNYFLALARYEKGTESLLPIAKLYLKTSDLKLKAAVIRSLAPMGEKAITLVSQIAGYWSLSSQLQSAIQHTFLKWGEKGILELLKHFPKQSPQLRKNTLEILAIFIDKAAIKKNLFAQSIALIEPLLDAKELECQRLALTVLANVAKEANIISPRWLRSIAPKFQSRLLKKLQEPHLVAQAIRAYAYLNEDRAETQKFLFIHLRKQPTPIRLVILDVLSDLGDKKLIPTLRDYLYDPSIFIRTKTWFLIYKLSQNPLN